MKKSLVIGAVLLAGMLIFFPVAFGLVYGQRDDVVITEVLVQGDRSAAEGVVVQLNRQWEDKLLWNTKVSLGENLSSETEFFYHPAGVEYETVKESEVNIHRGYFSVTGANSDVVKDSEDDYIDAVIDVAKEVQPGATLTKTVALTDFFEYYELNMYVYSAKHGETFYYDKSTKQMLSERLLGKIPENETVIISVKKNEQNEVVEYGIDFTESPIEVWGEGTILADSCYFAVNVVDRDKKSLVTDDAVERGIYKMPLKGNRTSEDVLWEEVELVYPLEGIVLAVEADIQEEYLYVLLQEGDTLCVHQFFVDTMEPVQVIELGKTETVAKCSYFEVTEKGILIILEYKQRKIYYLAQEEGLQPTVSVDITDNEFLTSIEIEDMEYDYQEGRLALMLYDSFWEDEYYAMVLEGDNILYLASLQNSLDHKTVDNVDLHETNPHGISFINVGSE